MLNYISPSPRCLQNLRHLLETPQQKALAESADFADFNNYALFLYIELTFMYYYIPLSARKNLRHLRSLREILHATRLKEIKRSHRAKINALCQIQDFDTTHWQLAKQAHQVGALLGNGFGLKAG